MEGLKQKQLFFLLCRILAIIVALFHVNKFFFPAESNATIHLIYVGISVISAYGLWKRPKWFTYFFGILLLQQLYSHGTYLHENWKTYHHFDGKSFAIILLMPIIFMALLKDNKNAS